MIIFKPSTGCNSPSLKVYDDELDSECCFLGTIHKVVNTNVWFDMANPAYLTINDVKQIYDKMKELEK